METIISEIFKIHTPCIYGKDDAEITAVNDDGILITFIGKDELQKSIDYDILKRRISIGKFSVEGKDSEILLSEINRILESKKLHEHESQIQQLREKEKTLSEKLSESENLFNKTTAEKDELSKTLDITQKTLEDIKSAKNQTSLVNLLFDKELLNADDNIFNDAFFEVDNKITDKKEKMTFSRLEEYKKELTEKINAETDEQKKAELQQHSDFLDNELEPIPLEISEWHSVSKNTAENLKKEGKPVIISGYGTWEGIAKEEENK